MVGGWWDSNPRLPVPQTGALPLNYSHQKLNQISKIKSQIYKSKLFKLNTKTMF